MGGQIRDQLQHIAAPGAQAVQHAHGLHGQRNTGRVRRGGIRHDKEDTPPGTNGKSGLISAGFMGIPRPVYPKGLTQGPPIHEGHDGKGKV